MTTPEPSGPMTTQPLFGLDQAEVSGLLTQLQNRKWAATLRPVPTFLGQESFSKPRTVAEATARVEANVPYFLTNYLIICLIVIIVTIITKPSLFFVVIALIAMWYWGSKQEVLTIGSMTFQGRNKMVLFGSITGITLFIFAGSTIFFLVGICVTIVLGHATLHNLPPLDDAEMNEFHATGAAIKV